MSALGVPNHLSGTNNILSFHRFNQDIQRSMSSASSSFNACNNGSVTPSHNSEMNLPYGSSKNVELHDRIRCDTLKIRSSIDNSVRPTKVHSYTNPHLNNLNQSNIVSTKRILAIDPTSHIREVHMNSRMGDFDSSSRLSHQSSSSHEKQSPSSSRASINTNQSRELMEESEDIIVDDNDEEDDSSKKPVGSRGLTQVEEMGRAFDVRMSNDIHCGKPRLTAGDLGRYNSMSARGGEIDPLSMIHNLRENAKAVVRDPIRARHQLIDSSFNTEYSSDDINGVDSIPFRNQVLFKSGSRDFESVSNELDLSSRSDQLSASHSGDSKFKISHASDSSPTKLDVCSNGKPKRDHNQIHASMLTSFQNNPNGPPSSPPAMSPTDQQSLMALFLKVNSLLSQKYSTHQLHSQPQHQPHYQESQISPQVKRTPSTSDGHQSHYGVDKVGSLGIGCMDPTNNVATMSSIDTALPTSSTNFSAAIQSYLGSLGIIPFDMHGIHHAPGLNSYCHDDGTLAQDRLDLSHLMSNNSPIIGPEIGAFPLEAIVDRSIISRDAAETSGSFIDSRIHHSWIQSTEATSAINLNTSSSRPSQSSSSRNDQIVSLATRAGSAASSSTTSVSTLAALKAIDFKNIRSFIANSSS